MPGLHRGVRRGDLGQRVGADRHRQHALGRPARPPRPAGPATGPPGPPRCRTRRPPCRPRSCRSGPGRCPVPPTPRWPPRPAASSATVGIGPVRPRPPSTSPSPYATGTAPSCAQVGVVGRARRADHRGAGQPGELHRERADRAGRGVHQQHVAGADAPAPAAPRSRSAPPPPARPRSGSPAPAAWRPRPRPARPAPTPGRSASSSRAPRRRRRVPVTPSPSRSTTPEYSWPTCCGKATVDPRHPALRVPRRRTAAPRPRGPGPAPRPAPAPDRAARRPATPAAGRTGRTPQLSCEPLCNLNRGSGQERLHVACTRRCTRRPAQSRCMTDSEAFADRLLGALTGAAELFTVELGRQLGLYRALRERARHPGRAGQGRRHRRAVRPRVAGTAGRRRHPDRHRGGPTATFALPERGRRRCCWTRTGRTTWAPRPQFGLGLGLLTPAVIEAFRSGKGISVRRLRHPLPARHRRLQPPDVHPRAGRRVAARHARTSTRGCTARVPGCSTWAAASGTRRSRWPGRTRRSTRPRRRPGRGVDRRGPPATPPSAGVADRVTFARGDAAEPGRRRTGRPGHHLRGAARHGRPGGRAAPRPARALADGGSVFIGDERVEDTFTAPAGEIERLQYAFSVLHCLPATRAEGDDTANGTILRRAHPAGVGPRRPASPSPRCWTSRTTSGASTGSAAEHRPPRTAAVPPRRRGRSALPKGGAVEGYAVVGSARVDPAAGAVRGARVARADRRDQRAPAHRARHCWRCTPAGRCRWPGWSTRCGRTTRRSRPATACSRTSPGCARCSAGRN